MALLAFYLRRHPPHGPGESDGPVAVGGDGASGEFEADVDHGVLDAGFGVDEDSVGISCGAGGAAFWVWGGGVEVRKEARRGGFAPLDPPPRAAPLDRIRLRGRRQKGARYSAVETAV